MIGGMWIPKQNLAFILQENVALKKVDLSFNGLGTEGSVCMGQALATNRTLLELDMSKNRITNVDMQLFTKYMGQNDTLQVLRVWFYINNLIFN